ncbi:LacI family DNA-binding transcriptional regulator [Arthrobacter sp. MMS24-T111]
MRSKPATAADVAERAGVSRATVSHILNGREGRFPEETRAKVRMAAAELDYLPSPAGRSLVKGHSDTIVLLAPNTTLEANLQEALEQLAEKFDDAGVNVVMRFVGPDPETTATSILKLRPMAVVDLGSLPRTARERLAANGVPTVPDMDRGILANGMPTDFAIAELQVAELTKNGPRQIVYAGLDNGRPDPFGDRRTTGLTEACERRGIPKPQRIVVPMEIAGAITALRGVQKEIPVAIAAYNDSVALAVLSAAEKLGLSVPDQISVVGVDRSELGQLWRPRLTSIVVDMRGLIDLAVAQFTAAIKGEKLPSSNGNDLALSLHPGESS